MSTVTISGLIPRNINTLLVKQTADKKRCEIVSLDVTKKVLER